jgi:uncharacterized membrane protein YeiB
VDLSTPTTSFTDTAPAKRLRGPDVVRAVALIGVVVMNYHGYLILRSLEAGTAAPRTGWLEELFDPWDGPLSTRFAATFVLVAGVGVTLLTRSAVGHPTRVTEMRWRLVRRGLLLYVLGLVLDEIWPGTIIVYYGAMFVLAAGVFTWRSRWIVAVGAGAAIAATSIRLWEFDRIRNGDDTGWLTRPDQGSVRRYLLDVFVDGTHPLLPWFAFLCAGIVLGRVLGAAWWRPAVISVGLILLSGAALLSSTSSTGLDRVALSLDPYDRSLVYVASALGSALVAYATVDWLAERFPVATDPLRRAGQMTLSLYLAHIVIFKLMVDWLGWIEPAGADAALLFAAGFWVVAVAAGVAWQRRFGRGPAEYVYRAFGG